MKATSKLQTTLPTAIPVKTTSNHNIKLQSMPTDCRKLKLTR